DTRTFYYGFSEVVVGAWIAQNGEAAYRAAWDKVGAGFADGAGCPCGEGWIEGILEDDALFRPWESVRASDPEGFDARVKPFVKDEAALEAKVNAEAGPLAGLGIPFPTWLAVVAASAAALFLRERRA
ncbi:MAG TPA: hypothetical protein VM370_13755, partial [Candidatus Thermoplasmatota archaeon]|nr:hypothetical protein [Candidatus Thermoplasmatota archaeon]